MQQRSSLGITGQRRNCSAWRLTRRKWPCAGTQCGALPNLSQLSRRMCHIHPLSSSKGSQGPSVPVYLWKCMLFQRGHANVLGPRACCMMQAEPLTAKVLNATWHIMLHHKCHVISEIEAAS